MHGSENINEKGKDKNNVFEHTVLNMIFSEQTDRTREEWAKICRNEIYIYSENNNNKNNNNWKCWSSAMTNLFVTDKWNICKTFHGVY